LGSLIWFFEGMFKHIENGRENGYDGFNQALKHRVESSPTAN